MQLLSFPFLILIAISSVSAFVRPLSKPLLVRSSLRFVPSEKAPCPLINDETSASTFSFELFSDVANNGLIGEDAAKFELQEQNLKSWGQFFVAVGGVLAFLFYVWIYGDGPRLGDQYKDLMEGLAGGDSTLAITYMLGFFAVVHSGLASLRPTAEQIIGARPWRYVFAIASLPLALSSIVYFINHRFVTNR
jgi:hypothetical protein